jgi:Fe-S cluster assembly protein SufD
MTKSPFPFKAHSALNTSLNEDRRVHSQDLYLQSQIWDTQKRRSESWKYFPFSDVLKQEYQEGQKESHFDWDTHPALSDDALTLYTLNGHLCLDQLPSSLPKGIQVFAQSDPQFSKLKQKSDQSDALHPLHALNRARTQDGWVVYIEPGTKDCPSIWIEHRSSHKEQTSINHPRVFIYGSAQSEFSVVETFIDSNLSAQSITNSVSEVHLEQESKLTYLKIQNQDEQTYHVGTHQFYLAESAWCDGVFLNLGSHLTRLDLDAHLQGPHAQIHLKGLYTGSSRQILDQHLTLSHHAPQCESSQHFKGILNHKSQGIFTGKVYVAPGAHGTLAHQHNPNLILDHKARVMTRPQLEIYNDDVECSHGATVGQLDENALFYLKSRGLSHETAVIILTTAFASQIQEYIVSEALQDQCTQAIQRTLKESIL